MNGLNYLNVLNSDLWSNPVLPERRLIALGDFRVLVFVGDHPATFIDADDLALILQSVLRPAGSGRRFILRRAGIGFVL